MAARAKIRFSTSGSEKVTGAFGKIGSSAGRAGTGIGAAFSKIMYNVGRMSMFSAGLQMLGKGAIGAGKSFGKFREGAITAFSAISQKFAQYRRQYYFLKFSGEKIATAAMAVGGLGAGMGGATKVKTPEGKKAATITQGAVAPTQAAQVSATKIAVATTAWQKFLGVLSGGAGKIGNIAGKIFSLSNLLKTFVGVVSLAAVAGGVAFVVLGFKTAKFAKRLVLDFMNIREAFRQYEISIGGVIRNTYAVGKMMQFATKYASEYPAMFEEVLDTFRSLSALPALKPMFRRADEQDLKGIMDVIQGLATLDPIQGVKGAGIALREALSGDMRSIRRRFEISARNIAEAGGYTLSEITQNSEKALKAFRAFIELNVPAKSMADAAMTIGIQFGNLEDKYRGFTNTIMKSTGAYWSVVTALSSLNDWLQKVFASPIIKEWATKAGNNIRAFVETLKSVLSGINWKKYLESGDLLGGMIEAVTKFSVFLKVMVEKWSQPFLEFVSKVSKILWKGLMPVIGMIASSMWILFRDGAIEAGTMAASAFILAFLGVFTTKGDAAMRAATKDFMVKAAGKTKNEERFGEKFLLGGIKLLSGYTDIDEPITTLDEKGKEITASVSKLREDIKKEFQKFLDIEAPEIVTPELAIEQHKWIVKDLQNRLAANIKNNDSLVKRKSILESLAKAEAALAMAGRREEFAADPKGGVLLKATTEQIGKIKAQLVDAYKAGRNLGAPIYDLLNILENLETKLQGVSDKFVEQLDPAKKLVALIHSTTDSMKEWGEEYEISKKGAGGLLLIVKKLNDILTRKIEAPDKEGMESLLQERIKLTDKTIEKEKEYRKEIKKTTESIAERFTKLSMDLSSSITSFFDKYGRYLKKYASYSGIGGQTMVPENLFGTGRPKLSYREGLETAPGTRRTPAYIEYMLKGINKAMTGLGIGKTIEGRLSLSNLKLDLLGRKFEKSSRREKPDVLAKLAGTQADNMKMTVAKATKDAQVQVDIRTAAQRLVSIAEQALGVSKDTKITLDNMGKLVPGTLDTPKSVSSSQVGNSKITGANPVIIPNTLKMSVANY